MNESNPQKFFISDDGKQKVSLDKAEVLAGIKSGKYSIDTLAWTTGSMVWLPLSDPYWDKHGVRISLEPPPLPQADKANDSSNSNKVCCDTCFRPQTIEEADLARRTARIVKQWHRAFAKGSPMPDDDNLWTCDKCSEAEAEAEASLDINSNSVENQLHNPAFNYLSEGEFYDENGNKSKNCSSCGTIISADWLVCENCRQKKFLEQHQQQRIAETKRREVKAAIAALAGITLAQKRELEETTENLEELNEKIENGEVAGYGGDIAGGGDAGGGEAGGDFGGFEGGFF